MIRTQNMSLPVIYLAAVAFFALSMDGLAAGGSGPLLNEPVDVSPDFYDFTNLYYLADKLSDFDPAAGTGKLTWQRAQYFTRQAFDHMAAGITPVGPKRISQQ